MKYTLLILSALAFGLASFGQIQVKETPKLTKVGSFKNGSSIAAELSFYVKDKDTIYYLIFNDLQYKHITEFKSFYFSGEDNTIGELYDILKTFFSDENKKNKDYTKSLKLGDTDVRLMNFRVMGTTSIMFHAKGGYFYITEKQLNKLFGK